MPRPSSRTTTRTSSSIRSAARATVPPSGEYLIAFESRLPTTCAHRQRSVRDVDLEAVVRALRRVQLRLLLEQGREIDALACEIDALVLDPLHVEKVLEQRRQPSRLRVDDAEVV